MSVLVLGLNYRTAPISLLERLAVPSEQLPKALASLSSREDVSEAVVLSTCNRVEVYAHVSRYHGGMADLRNFFSEWSGVPPEDFSGLAYDYYDGRAATHLFAVTSGLDSMVVGERQIQLQVKRAFRDAEDEGACGRVLQSLFRRALRVGKRARTETGISAGASSMVDVGLDAAVEVLGDLSGRTALIVGAGKMGGMAAARLQSRAGRILVANRSPEKRERLAAKVGGDELDLADLSAGVGLADFVMASTGAPQPVIDREMVATAMRDRADRPLVLLDLAVPRDVDATRAGTHPGRTGEEVAKARALVEEEARAFAAWTRTVRVEPTISALRARAEGIRAAEVERLVGRLGQLDEKQRAAVDQLTRGIVNTLLHEPSVRLKEIADRRGGELYAQTLRELFDLGPELG